MSESTVPDEAVEAVAKAYLREFAHDENAEYIARLALEAAAPHMGREAQWGVRDRISLHIAGHPSEESAKAAAVAHPEWYEVVSRPMPGLWSAK